MLRLVPFASLEARPWKNGGGTTRQIACFPPAAGLDDFDWRLSTASVGQDGAFSLFPGVDRWLSVLDGAGLELGFADRTERLLPGGHVEFPGEAEVMGRLIDGPVTDFNIMVRRGRRGMVVRALQVNGEAHLALPWDTAALFLRDGEVAAGGITAGRHDTLLCEGPMEIMLSGAASLLVIGLPAA